MGEISNQVIKNVVEPAKNHLILQENIVLFNMKRNYGLIKSQKLIHFAQFELNVMKKQKHQWVLPGDG